MNPFYNWLAMGGYSFYIWSAYGLVFGFLILNFFSVQWQKKSVRQRLYHWFKRQS